MICKEPYIASKQQGTTLLSYHIIKAEGTASLKNPRKSCSASSDKEVKLFLHLGENLRMVTRITVSRMVDKLMATAPP